MKATANKETISSGNNSPFFNTKNGTGFFGVQPKLNIGKRGDKYEQEADSVADKVVDRTSGEGNGFFNSTNSFFGRSKSGQQIQEKPLSETITPLVQMQEMEEEEILMKQDISREEEEEIQMQPVAEEEEEVQMQPMEEEEEEIQPQFIQRQEEEEEEELQAKFIQKQDEEEEEMLQPFTVNPVKGNYSVENNLKNSSDNGTKMDNQTRKQMESGFGADFSSVKIHTGAKAVQMNKDLGAQAFTHGKDIYFNEGKYDPASKKGKHLLAHELTHTLQQGASKVKPENGNPDNLDEHDVSSKTGKVKPEESNIGKPENETSGTENIAGKQKPAEKIKNQTKKIEEDTKAGLPAEAKPEQATTVTQSAGQAVGTGGKDKTSLKPAHGQKEIQQGKQSEKKNGEESIISEEQQAEQETAGGGGGGGPEPGTKATGKQDQPKAVKPLSRIISAPNSALKPHVLNQALIIKTDSISSQQQVRQLALLRRISVNHFFIGMQARMHTFFGLQQGRLHGFIAEKQTAAVSMVMGAIQMVQGVITGAIERGISYGNLFAQLVNGFIDTSIASVNIRVSGIADQITGLINSVSLPDIPGVEFARNMAQNAVNGAARVVLNALNNVVALIRQAFYIGMNLFNTFLFLLISKVNLAFSLVSSVLMRILNMIFNLLNRVLNLVSSILGQIFFGTVFPLLDRLSSGMIKAINQKEQEAINQIEANTKQHLEALAEAVAPKADTGGGTGDGGGGGGGPSKTATPVTFAEFIAGIQQISQSSLENNRKIVQVFNTETSSLAALFIPGLINAVNFIISEIRNRIAAVITNVISIVVSVIQKIRILVDVLNVFITTLIQEFISVVTGLIGFVVSLVQNPIERLTSFAQNTISRIRSFISRLISNFVRGNSISFDLSSILGNFSLSPATGLVAPAFAGPPIQIIGGLVIIIIGGVAFAISTFTAVIIVVVVIVVLLLLLYLLYKWLTKPKPPAPPKPPKKPTGKEYDPGINFNISYSVPLEKSDIQASKGEKLIFGVEASDEDRFRKIGTTAWTTIPGTGPYEVVYKVKGDADFITAGSGKKSHTDPTLHSRNIFLFIKNTWKGKKITVTATVRDKAVPAAPPDIGTTKDTKHKITWTIINRKNPCPTSLKRVGGAGSTWVAAPSVYTYLAMPEINPPGRPNYEKQTVLESFANTTANGSFTMADLKTSWKTAHPTLNTPDKVAVFLYGVSGNGTFVFNNQDRISDQHSGFGTTSPFKPAALNRASGVGYKKDQTYSCSTTNIGSAVIERKYSTTTGVMVKKTGP